LRAGFVERKESRMDTPSHPSSDHVSSQGHALAGVDWLDVHFEAERPEYEALLRSVGLRPGWHVLDAGSGAGGFLPLIAAEVGPTGRITALDLAPESVAAVARRIAGWALDCPVSTRVGSVLDLPLADGCLDAVWFANTSQYLSDHELRTALAEFKRVLRPGGCSP
jgi:ubiquinone/menaquinone biosynthesis C-methylase UbiE